MFQQRHSGKADRGVFGFFYAISNQTDFGSECIIEMVLCGPKGGLDSQQKEMSNSWVVNG